MKVALFLSRVTFICNIAFLLFVFFTWQEQRGPVKVAPGTVIHVPLAKEIIIILGFTAIIINLLMNIAYLIFALTGKNTILPRWLVAANFVFLLLQFCYFFLFNNR
jgi:hypothetical protein